MGQIQVLHQRLQDIAGSPLDARQTVSLGRAIGSVIGGIATIVFASHVLVLVVVQPSLVVLATVLLVYGVIGAVWVADARDGRIGPPSASIVAAPLIYPGLGILTIASLFAYAFTWQGEWYRVMKTGRPDRPG